MLKLCWWFYSEIILSILYPSKNRQKQSTIKMLKAKKEFNIDSDPLIRIQVGFVHRWAFSPDFTDRP